MPAYPELPAIPEGNSQQRAGESQHRRVHVNEIGDQRGGEAVVVEPGADNSRLAVMQRAHPIEEVGYE